MRCAHEGGGGPAKKEKAPDRSGAVSFLSVMAGLDPAIHLDRAWMAASEGGHDKN